MYGVMTNDHDAQRTIREKAEIRYGGTTSTWKVSNEIKRVCQRFDVGDLVTIEPSSRGGLRVNFGRKLEQRLRNRSYEFLRQLMEEIECCGYSIASGDDFMLLDRA